MQLSPHVIAVTSHYRKKLEKDDIKRLSKEVSQPDSSHQHH
jgi:hypothetical protein